MKRDLTLILVVFLITLGLPIGAYADSFEFEQITNNSGMNFAADFSLDVTELPMNRVKYQWNNKLVGNVGDGVIGQVYIQAAAIPIIDLTSATILPSAGVSFSSPANPGDLPSGNTIGFSADYSAGATPPPPFNGVNPGENLMISFDLLAGKTFADLIASITAGQGTSPTNEQRIGIHGISLGPNNDSESFIVPIPSTLLFFGAGFAAFVGWRRYEDRKSVR